MSTVSAVESQAAEGTPPVDAVIAAVDGRREPAILDSADTGPSRGRYTIVACDPVEVASWPAGGADPFDGMRRRLAETRIEVPVTGSSGDDEGLRTGRSAGFVGGWIGYFAYEAGRYIERLPASTGADVGLPVARFALYDSAAIHDALTQRWTLLAVDLRATGIHSVARPDPADRLAGWQALLIRAASSACRPPPQPALRPVPANNMTRAQYLRTVQRAKDYIAAGDIFQVNLARRLTFPLGEPAIALYRRLRQTNPGAYAAFLRWSEPDGDGRDGPAILSASPELFLQLRDGCVVTRPIKGTRPRSADPVVDAANAAQLAASEKDRAELAMIVDLERNDLGRVCAYGSVRVLTPEDSPAAPYVLEAHPTVHHLVATVAGRLAPGRDAIDLLRASFPGGSITGAPKVRAMQIIDELEPTERGVYTGAIGCLSLDGSMTVNIAIRTMIAARGQVHVYAGGGIVADSVPEDEYDETSAKALGLCRALGAESSLAPVSATGGRCPQPRGVGRPRPPARPPRAGRS